MDNCVFCTDPITDGEGTTDDSGALAHDICAEIEFAAQRFERAEHRAERADRALKTIAGIMHPERMSSPHLNTRAKLERAYAVITNMQNEARDAISGA